MSHIRRYFLTGLAVVLPTFVSFYVLYVVGEALDGLLGGMFRGEWIRPGGIPGLGLLSLLLFILLFATTGIGNGSTFRMIPIIFEKEQAGPVLGWTSAIAAYGAFLIPKIFATQIKAGTPEYALYGFALYYASCLAVNWWFYARKNAEIKC